jgi:hypothetical protein
MTISRNHLNEINALVADQETSGHKVHQIELTADADGYSKSVDLRDLRAGQPKEPFHTHVLERPAA